MVMRITIEQHMRNEQKTYKQSEENKDRKHNPD
jgi:hypothetical protein